MLEKLRITRFCCCCTTRTGALVIGVFGWIGSLMHSIALSTPTQTTKISENVEGELVMEKQENSNVGPILLSVFMVGISAAMVYGIYQNNRRFILPWLVIKGIECSILTIATFVLFFMLFVSDEVGLLFLVFFIIAAFTALFWYFFICVWSLYMDMGETMSTIVPMGQLGQSIPMTEPNKQYQMNDPIKSPPQEMV